MTATRLLDPWRNTFADSEERARAVRLLSRSSGAAGPTTPEASPRSDLSRMAAERARPAGSTPPRLCFSELPAADGPCREHRTDRYLSHRERLVDGGLGRYVFVHADYGPLTRGSA